MNRIASFEVTAPLGTQLIADLRQRIITGVFPPGTRLSEQEIAATFGLSRQPVREAFIKLAAERLIEIRPQRGSYVRKIDLDDVAHAQFVREAVEADIVRIAAETADTASVEDLRAQIVEQKSRKASDPAAFFSLDEEFHRSLAAAAGRQGVWEHIQPIKMQMDRVRYLATTSHRIDHLVEQHDAVVEAIASRDAEAAEAAIRTHLKVVLNDLRTIATELPDYFHNKT